MTTIKMNIVIPAIASLVLFATNPASARTVPAPQKAQAGMSGDGLSVSDAAYTCRSFANYMARQHCRALHGIPDNS